ncbi:hypothetical protein H4Q26_006661 [Puccinia striiformis f. sp. tritici PST-130]|nr:hypothetical protein H4Q26_006661 [Puccinia striiformis f. sp. tritici PST-130]
MNQDNPTSSKLQPGTQVQVGQYVVQVEKFLSEGGFAHVYVASLVSPSNVEGFPASQNRFVLKRMAVPDKPGLVEVRKEVDVMKQLRPHKHIVYFIEASASSIPGSNGYEIFILMEWCPGGGIIDLLNSRLQNRLTESEILKIFSDTVSAVAHMHSQNPILIHRDLKVENILVASPNLYKLCDFGSTTSPLPRPPQSSAEIVALEADLNKHTTLQYRAPEMVDVWSRRGVTEKQASCYYTTPFEAHGPLAIMNVPISNPLLSAYSNSVKYLIGTMLQELAQSRPDIWEVHEHVCRLRGITPNLRRPSRKHSISNVSSLPPLSTSALPNPLTTSPIKMDWIRSSYPLHPQRSRKGSPNLCANAQRKTGVKSKLEAPVPNGDTFLQSVPSASTNFPSKKESPPEESDLFAREAAAGFGDAFLSLSPQINSFKPIVRSNPSVNTSSGTGLITSRSHLSLKSTALTPTSRQDIVKSSSSSAFEDLKTGPQTLPSHSSQPQQQGGYLKMSITQKTGPAIGSVVKPSMSDWLQKDQPILSKNTTVTTTTHHHHKQSLDTGYQHTTRRENDRIQQTSASILDDSRSTRRVQEPGSFLMPQQPSAKAATTAAQELSSESDSSDEEPEDPDGRGRTAYRGPYIR